VRAIDVGCGSGILAIAAALLGVSTVLGLDTDQIAVDATVANAKRNRLARRIRARRGTLPSGDRPFDAVFANLIASLLIDLAPALRDELRPSGRLVASGIFIDREEAVRTAFEACGLRVLQADREGEWVALTAERIGDAPGVDGDRASGRIAELRGSPNSEERHRHGG
jgi:ribosomal protein L11 methyltransferase